MDGYYSMDAVHAAHDKMCEEFGNLAIELENALQENERLKQEKAELIEIIDRHVLRKMYPAKCTDKIQVFESREEYDKVLKFMWKLMKEESV